MDNSEYILTTDNLLKRYKEFTLGELNLTIPKGYIIGMIGPNGAGKTTTIKLLMNLMKADDGMVNIFGLTYKSHEKEIKNRVGYVGEVQYFYENRTVNWTGKFVSQFYNNWDENNFTNLLNEFKISRSKKVKELSKGMRVKLALAIALSHNAELIILDEPTSGLDPLIRREVLDLLMRFTQDENRSILVSSHITTDLERIADYVMFMNDGKIQLSSPKDELLSDWKKIHYKPGVIDKDIQQVLIQKQEGQFGSSGIIQNYGHYKQRLLNGIEHEDIKVENIDLDDILISIVKGESCLD